MQFMTMTRSSAVEPSNTLVTLALSPPGEEDTMAIDTAVAGTGARGDPLVLDDSARLTQKSSAPVMEFGVQQDVAGNMPI